jgi:hypothetical protein
MAFCFKYRPLEILDSGTCLPDEPLRLKLIPTNHSSIPLSLNPTSNGKVVLPGKMSLYGLFRYSLTTSPDWLNPSWQVTQRIQRVCQNYNDRQIRRRPEVFSFGIIERPIPLSGLPCQYTMRLLRRLHGVNPNLLTNLIQFLTAAF